MGVGTFTIYEDESSAETEHLSIVLQDYIKENIVKVIRWPDQAKVDSGGSFSYELNAILDNCTNHKSYNECYQAAALHCLETHNYINWVIILDSQDFIFPKPEQQQSSHLRTLEHVVMDYYSNCSSIVVPAYTFNNISQDSDHLVIEKYLTRNSARSEDLFLTILNPKEIEPKDIQISTISRSLVPSLFPRAQLILNNSRVKCQEERSAIRLHHYQYKPSNSYITNGAAVDVSALYIIPHLREVLAIRAQECPSCTFTDTDPSLFVTHNHKTPYAIEEIPPLCIALLSCRRIGYLRRTIKSIINYLAKVEPWVKYEIVLVDNGSDDAVVEAILEEFPIEKVALMRKNYGITVGINTAFFGLCQSPYILSLEDDWESRWTSWDVNVPAISMSMGILQNDPKVLEVWLRDINHEHPAHHNRDANWTFIPATGNTPLIQYKRQFQQIEGPWGTYTNGASLKRKSSLEEIGHMVEIDGELEYAIRTGKLGYAAGVLCLLAKGCDDQYGLTNYDSGLFYHIGRDRSPGRIDFIGKTWNE